MKARLTHTKVGMTVLTVLSLMVVATGCKTSSKKKSAAKAVPTATPIPTAVPTPPTDTSTDSNLNLTGIKCTPKELSQSGLSNVNIIINLSQNRMTVQNTTSNMKLGYTLTPKQDTFYDKGQYEVRLDTTLLPSGVVAPNVIVGELNKNLSRYKFSKIQFLDNSSVNNSAGGTLQKWMEIGTSRLGIGIPCE